MKRLLTILLSAAFLLTALGCGGNPADTPTGETITDAAGAVLPIPEDGGKETIASVYAVAVPFIVALDLENQVLAINCKSSFWTTAGPALGEAGSVGRGVMDLEALASYRPTVVLHRVGDPKTVEAVEKLGIRTLCISAEDMEGVKDTLALLGKYFGKSARAQEVSDWIDGKLEKIDGIVATIPQEERVTALVMGGELGRVAGGDMLQTYMIEKAGGIPVAKDVTGNRNWASVGVETIFTWNPDVLFCTSSTVLEYAVEDLLTDPTWAAMRAIQTGRVSVFPARIDSWDLPGVASVLAIFYMLHEMYPSYFTADQLQAEVDEYYTMMFGKTFDADYLGYTLE